jgi:hypothetical protein
LTRQQAQANPSLTIAELCKAFYDRQIKEGRAFRTKGLCRASVSMKAKHVVLDCKIAALDEKDRSANHRQHKVQISD